VNLAARQIRAPKGELMPLSNQSVLEVLHAIQIPGSPHSLVEAGAIRDLEIDGSTVRLELALQVAQPSDLEALRERVESALQAVDEIGQVELQIQPVIPMASAAPHTQPEPTGWADKIPGIKRVVAVASGKGGVGKSTVAANLAHVLARRGFSVGLLDADIYGPSQQLMMGATDEPMADEDGKIYPVEAPGGVRVMSFGFLVDTDQPVIWRGPMLQKALEQFFGDVRWGELDFLLVDLPPGTGDVALTLCQNVPLAGAIIVTTPQDVALIDARKSLHMFAKLETRVLGLVENMSGFECPECGHVEHVFGSGGGARTADALGVPLLGSVPLDPAVVVGGDTGAPVVVERPDSTAAKAFSDVADRLAKATS
jgi:ATP-binding protein involved in chromosome partitioning